MMVKWPTASVKNWHKFTINSFRTADPAELYEEVCQWANESTKSKWSSRVLEHDERYSILFSNDEDALYVKLRFEGLRYYKPAKAK